MDDQKIREKFEEIYKSKIEPKVRESESYRLGQKKKYDLLVKLSICLYVVGIGMFFLGYKGIVQMNISVMACIVSMIMGSVLMLCSNRISNNFRKTIKADLLIPIIGLFGNFNIADKPLLSLKDIKALGLYHKARQKTDDDNIVGTYKEIPVTLIETRLSHTEHYGKSTSHVTDFNGLILKIRMNKKFDSITIGEQKKNIDNYIKTLREASNKNSEMYPPEMLKYLDNPVFNTISQAQKFMSENKLYLQNGKLHIDVFDLHTKNRVTRKLEKINLEDPEFNDNYNVYSDNQVESRYLLSPTFMERIKNIQSVFLSPSVDFVFKEGFLYLFLDGSICPNELVVDFGNGFFEVGDISNTLLNKNIYLKLFRELVSIFSLISYFKLDENTKS